MTDTRTKRDLLPCPFCGSRGIDRELSRLRPYPYCTNCGANGPIQKAAWNSRTILDAPPAQPVAVEGAPERHSKKDRNVIINRSVTDLDGIINGHDPEVDTNLNNLVWDRLDKMAVEIENLAHPSAAPTDNTALVEVIAKTVAYSGDLSERREWSDLLPETKAHYRKIANAVLAALASREAAVPKEGRE